MVLDKIFDLLADKEPAPNKFTIQMGELIRAAREEEDLSQAELARKIYRRQATISSLENGKSEVGSVTLTLLAAALNKPITYFFPDWTLRRLVPEQLNPEEQELLTHFQRIWNPELRSVAIAQVRTLAEHDIEQTLAREAAHRDQQKRSNQTP